MIEYHELTDEDKLDVLRLMYSNLKKESDKNKKEIVINEAMKVYERLKSRSH